MTSTFRRLRQQLHSVRDRAASSLLGSARASAWALVGQIAVAVAGLANFLLLARLVGPSDYGMIAGTLALVLTVGPFAAVGADKLVTRDIAVAPDTANRALTHAALTVLLGGTLSIVLLALLHPVLLPQAPLGLLVALGVAELYGGGLMLCCAGSRFATDNGRAGGLTMATMSLAKITAVVLFALTDGTDPLRWAWLYSGLSVTATAVVTVSAFHQFGAPTVAGYRPLQRLREGLPYSANVTATVAQNDIDKTLLVRAGFSEQAGLYSVAYRLATLAWLPVLAVLQATMPRFFALGAEGGLTATSRFARRLLRPLMAYAVFSMVVLLVVAPLIPVLVGEDYRGSVVLLMLLAPLTMFKVAQYVPSDALTGAGRQPLRTACIATSMVVNVTLGLLFIPRYGIAAALLATLLAETLYVVLVFIAVRWGVAGEAADAEGSTDDVDGSPSTSPTGSIRR